jgi:hypothetical protein
MVNYTSMPYSSNVFFIEAPIFSKLIYDYLSEVGTIPNKTLRAIKEALKK